MRRLIWLSQNVTVSMLHGPAPIVVGLAFLMAAMIWPGIPAATGMALVMLGATNVTLARFRGTIAVLPVVILHVAVYGGLYAIFVGATIHAANNSVGTFHQLAYVVASIDLALSIVPMAMAIERVWHVLNGGHLAE